MFDNIKLQGKDNDNLKKDLIRNKEAQGLISREKKNFILGISIISLAIKMLEG